MDPILCVGESIESRTKGDANQVIGEQITKGLENIASLDNLIIAYEPIWAIGTGESASSEIAQEMSLAIRNKINELYGIITWSDLHDAAEKHERHLTVQDYCTTDLITVTPEDTLTEALDSLGYKEISHLPVVRKENDRKIIGIITKGDLIKAYNKRRFVQKKMSWQD